MADFEDAVEKLLGSYQEGVKLELDPASLQAVERQILSRICTNALRDGNYATAFMVWRLYDAVIRLGDQIRDLAEEGGKSGPAPD